MQLTGQNYIAGKTSAEGSETFTSVNPRTKEAGDVQFHNATESEINRAVESAVTAFKEVRTYSADQLADLLDEVADQIEALGDELLEVADMETGLGIPRLTGERGRTTGQLRAFGELLRDGSYVRAIIDTEPNIRQMQFPIGPVAVFSASNFPFAFAVAGGDTASAFAAGCPVIVKGHPGHPATSELFAQALSEAVDAQDFPKGMFSMIQGNTIEVGQNLVMHDGIEAVGFTGSLKGGRAIYNSAAERDRPIPVYAEMGSINPVVITQKALANRSDEIAEGLVNSVTLGTGQFCTNPGLILMENTDATQAFIESVTSQMKQEPEGVLLNGAIESGLEKAVNATKTKDSVAVLTGAEPVDNSEFFCYRNTVMQTTSEAVRTDDELQIEHFGPVTLFVLCDDMKDLTETVQVVEGNLTTTIHAEDDELDEVHDLLHLMREKAGRVIWNGFPTGVAVVYSMQHGGPYPATTAPSTTSVGMTAIYRFMRPIAFQSVPDKLLPDALKDENPLDIMRIVDNEFSDDAI